jgi:uncharacterized protein YggT (Ycf19 family)
VIAGYTLSGLVSAAATFYMYLVFAYVLLSWVPIREGFLLDAYRVLASLCEPYIGLFRRFVPVAQVGGAGIDFAPFVALIVLQIARTVLVQLLRGF